MKKNKSISGGILLEVLFMLGIMVAIFPMIQSDVKKRTDAIRNQMVVRDLIKLKTAVEEYLKRKPTFDKTGVYDVGFNELYNSGLEPTFKSKSVLGQNYKVRIKFSESGGNTSYDAIVIATGDKSIPTVRLRDIVKEAKGYVGYVEKDGESFMSYSPSWQISLTDWNENFGDIDQNSLIVKAGLAKKEYKYITRSGAFGTSTMETDLDMGGNSIVNISNLYISGTLKVNDFELAGGNNLKINSIVIAPSNNGDSSLEVSGGNMTIKEALRFTDGLNMSNLNFSDAGVLRLFVNSVFRVTNLTFNTDATCSFPVSSSSGDEDYTSSSICNKIRLVDTTNLLIPTEGVAVMYIANLFRLYDNNPAYFLNVKNLVVKSFDNDKNISASGGSLVSKALDFNQIDVDGYAQFGIKSKTMNFNDIIVTQVNKKLMVKSSKIGGISINEKSPLSLIFRGLWYAYNDVWYLVNNSLDYDQNRAGLFNHWQLNPSLRCEYEKCSSSAWYQ